MNKLSIDFQNCMRLQIIPDEYTEQRTEQLIAHCKKFGFTNVMFLINAEDFYRGHLTPEEIKPWVETVKKVSQDLRSNGISIGLHHWISVGHIDRGIGLKENQNFTTMVDFNGKKSISCACPLDVNWRKHFSSLLYYLITEIKPDCYWVEDDFRLHNHAPLEWGGCFCDIHIKEFNKLLGTNYTREEFCEKAFSKGEPTKERKAWLDVSKHTMLDTAKFIKETIKSANPDTAVALMTSFPQEHCLEARDWNGIFDIFGDGGPKLNRIHLPGYFERIGKDYMYDFNALSMGIRAFSPKDTKILPELENGPISIHRKSARFLGFELESAIPLCLSGMTYNIFDNVGNGPLEEYGYSQEIKRLTPYMQAVMDSSAAYQNLQGVVIPIDEKIAYKKSIKNNFYDLRTNLFNTAAFVSALGLSYRYTTEKQFKNETVFLFGDAVYIFTDEQLIALFKDNNVVLDGGAALLLKERNMLSLIGASNALLYPAESGYQTYEKVEDGIVILGIKGFRASCRSGAGDFVKIDYTTNPNILSRVYKADGTLGWDAFAEGENFLVFPFVVNEMRYTQFAEPRRNFVTSFVNEKTAKIIDTGYEGINPYLFCGEDETIVMLVNATLETFEKIEFFIKGISFNKIVAILKDGTEREVAYINKNGKLTLDHKLNYMSTATLKLQK